MRTGLLIIIKYPENCTATLHSSLIPLLQSHKYVYVYIYTLSRSTFTKREAQYHPAGLTTYNIHYHAENLLMPV